MCRLLGDQTRLAILCELMREPDGMCVYEIAEAVGASHSATSHQLAKLEAAGAVEGFREGQTICYLVPRSAFTRRLQRLLRVFGCT